MADTKSSKPAYLFALGEKLSSAHCYLSAHDQKKSYASCYTFGCISSTRPAYTQGSILQRTSAGVFVPGLKEDVKTKRFAFCVGILRTSAHVYTGGIRMPSVDYIWLKTSSGNLAKKFRVLLQDYDDGTLEKAENVTKTIGGGIDHSVGAIYKTWSMIIRVRHEETDADFGSMSDLEYFYSLNNPGGTPSNDITFVDHHNEECTVHTVGKLTKNILGTEIEGECAWFLYRLQLIRIQ